MSTLVPNVFRTRVLDQFPEPANFTTGIKSITIHQALYQDVNLRRELLVKQEIVSTNAAGWVLSRDVTEWDYDSASKLPMYCHTETWAKVYLPGVNIRSSLLKCEESWTRYWRESFYMSQSYRTIRSGYVIYDLAPTSGDVSAAQDRGYVTSGNTRRVLDSARDWRSATQQVAIVEKPTANQETVWVGTKTGDQRNGGALELLEHIAHEDCQKIEEWDVRHDCLRAGPPEVSNYRVTLKAPVDVEVPLDMEAPTLTASRVATGVRLEVRGGGGTVEKLWPISLVEDVAPERYVIYRRTVVAPASTTDDSYAAYDTADPLSPAGQVTLSLSAAVDFSGDPADPLPGATPMAKGDQEADPTADDRWQEIITADNQETVAGQPGRLMAVDGDVASGGQYEYQAVAVWRGSESPPSEVVALIYSGSRASGLVVWARKPVKGATPASSRRPSIVGRTNLPPLPRGEDNGIIDITDPDSIPAGVGAEPTDDTIGETIVMEVPAALSGWPDGLEPTTPEFGPELTAVAIDGTAESDPDGLAAAYPQGLTDVTTLVTEIAARVFERHGEDKPPQELSITPVCPIPFLERGQNIAVAAMAATITHAGTRYTITLPARTWRAEGFGWSISADGDGNAVVKVDSIECEALP